MPHPRKLMAAMQVKIPSSKVVTQDFWMRGLTQWPNMSRFAKGMISQLTVCLILTLTIFA